ncbi:MAG TPA: hypothetical protein VNB90_05890 [Cytophagaceae bacterium]|nr:hypothetical protein [Cytophagaceae bacterium]
MEAKKVLLLGIDPFLIDFSTEEFAAFPGLTASKVEAGIKAAIQQLNQKGYKADLCWVDFGLTAANVLEKKLKQTVFDIVLIGAGIRVPEKNFLLFEELLNVVHRHASKAKICFNTNPGDTIAAVDN